MKPDSVSAQRDGAACALCKCPSPTLCNDLSACDAKLLAPNAPDFLAALRAINRIASPNPERTFDQAIRDLEYIADVARSALSAALASRETRPEADIGNA